MITLRLRLSRLLPIRHNSTTATVKTDISNTPVNAEIPKDTIKTRFIKYWTNLFKDYSEVYKDVVNDAKERPIRAVCILWGLGFAFVSAKLNPNEEKFRENVRDFSNDVILVAERLQNPKAVNHLKFIEDSLNTGVLRRLNLGLFSIMWLSDYDHECKLYKCTCSYLKPHYSTYFSRIVDIGIWNKWWLLENALVDYDVNY